MQIFQREDVSLLIRAFLSLETEEECRAFLSDLMTTREILDLAQRLQVARLLDSRMVYSEISRATGASSATISRVNRCYAYGAGGYTAILPRLKKIKAKEQEQ